MRLRLAASVAAAASAAILALAAWAQAAALPCPGEFSGPPLGTVEGAAVPMPTSSAGRTGNDPVEMVVDSVRVDSDSLETVVLLRERAGRRLLPIWIGPLEAQAIAIPLEKVELPRPLTHDLLRSVIVALDGKLESVVVTDFSDNIYYAQLILDVEGRHLEIDSRPSDAIALALRMEAPIYVPPWLLESNGVEPDLAPRDIRT